MPLPTRVFLACGVTDMRKRFDGLAVLVQQVRRLGRLPPPDLFLSPGMDRIPVAGRREWAS
jgi:transposase